AITVMENQQCIISVCTKAPGQCMRKVTDWILRSAQDNQTLPAYLKVDDIVCQWCYNRIIVHPSVVMKEHTKVTYSVRSSITDATINALAELGITSTSQIVW
ncbi:16079_t:CDS:2, partial [Racocetra persica]